MALVLKINSTDRSSWIDWKSLQKTEGLTKEPDILSFDIVKTPTKSIPTFGDTVELLEDAVKIFSGTITERTEKVQGGITLGYSYKCKDPTHKFDKLLVVKSYQNQTAQEIIEDIVDTFTDGTFTYTNIEAGTPTLGTVKFNYEQPSKAIQKIANLIGYDWYIDYDNDVHFFSEGSSSAPFEINDTEGNLEWRTLNFDRNIIELKNSIIIRGGEYSSTISEANAVDKYIADGTQRVFVNIYRYKNIQVKVNNTAKTVGIDNIDDPDAYDCLYNYQEKAVKFRENNKPSASQEIEIFGDAQIPLIAKVKDSISVSTYGEFQHVEIDKTITSVSEAKQKARALLDKWTEGSWDGSFTTTQTGLRTGMQIRINSTIFGIDKLFKITRIMGRTRTGNSMEYNVQFIASGETTFTDIMVGLLGKDRQNIDIADDEVLQRLELFTETLSISDSLGTPITTTGPYTWGTSGASDLNWSFGTWS